LVDHAIDGVDEIQDLSEHWHAYDFLSKVSPGHSGLQSKSTAVAEQ